MKEELLEIEALRYACGDLDGTEAAAFEARLAGDQPACEALALAVGCLPPLFDRATPHPRYRLRVRERLRFVVPASAGLNRLKAVLRTRLLWALGGAAAATIVLTLFPLGQQLFRGESAAGVSEMVAAPAVPDDDPAARRAAVRFAELSTVERLSRVHDEEALRKRKSDGRRLRPLAPESIRPMSPMMPPISPGSMM